MEERGGGDACCCLLGTQCCTSLARPVVFVPSIAIVFLISTKHHRLFEPAAVSAAASARLFPPRDGLTFWWDGSPNTGIDNQVCMCSPTDSNQLSSQQRTAHADAA